MDLTTIDHLLTTTRSVRKRLDFARAVEPEIIERCLEIAIQAPSGSNSQGWHFVVVTDAEKRLAIADYYRLAYADYIGSGGPSGTGSGDDPRLARASQIRDSADYLVAHLHEVPVFIIPCIEGRCSDPAPSEQAGFYGCILPATWSLMLALRARGLGASWTTLHLDHEKEVAELLGIPANVTQAALLPVAYFLGDDFQPAYRVPARGLTYWNGWGATR